MSKNIEDEIREALHAQPATGSLDPRLDFFIKQAEIFIEQARETIVNKMPEGPYAEHKSVAYESMNQTILTCGWQVNAQIGSIDQSLALTKQAGEQQFSRCISRPQNTSEEALNRAWQSLKGLLDSLNGSAITTRIKEELLKACQPYGGDETSKYLLRDGEQLISRYLESRRQSLDPYFEAIKTTALAYETDIIGACETILLARRLEKQWPPIRQSLLNQLSSLGALAQQQALSWDQPAKGLSIQSERDGSINAKFASLEEFRQFCRKHGQGF